MWATGFFEDSDQDAPAEFFFPPSSFAHIRELPGNPVWPNATDSRLPVDSAFLLDAHSSGAKFGSTHRFTVFKFTSTGRFLSYLAPETVEQTAILDLLVVPAELDIRMDEWQERAKAGGSWMALRHSDPRSFDPRTHLQHVETVRGIDISVAPMPTPSTWIDPVAGWLGFDWMESRTLGGWTTRAVGPTRRPRMLVPLLGDEPMRLDIHLSGDADTILGVVVNGVGVETTLSPREDPPGFVLSAACTLHATRASYVQLHLRPGAPPPNLVFFGIEVSMHPEPAIPGSLQPWSPTQAFELASLRAKSQQLEEYSDAASRLLDDARTLLAQRDQDLADVWASTSWRASKPIRVARALIDRWTGQHAGHLT